MGVSIIQAGETVARSIDAAPILVSESGDTVQTKRAVHRFSAIKMRSLNER
jgi:hypothetical protein